MITAYKYLKPIEAPRSKLRGIFDRKEFSHFSIRSLTPWQAAGNALAVAVQGLREVLKLGFFLAENQETIRKIRKDESTPRYKTES